MPASATSKSAAESAPEAPAPAVVTSVTTGSGGTAGPAPVAAPQKHGRLYLALANLSISRRNTTKEDQAADIVQAGETVVLADDEAHGFLHRHRVPVVRLATDQEAAAKPPRILARDIFGKRPVAAQFGVGEDPAGSTRVDVHDSANPSNHPEAADATVEDIAPDSAKGR